MTQSLSLIHPEAPEFLSAAALYSAPIDVEAASKGVARAMRCAASISVPSSSFH